MKCYRPQLDGLRAIAIGLVGIEHYGGPLVHEHFPISAGAVGVHLFFVLSGFLITRNLLLRLDGHSPGDVIRRFFIGRAARLAPAYYLALLVLFALGAPKVSDHIFWHLTYMSNYLAATGGPLLVFWSLAVEEQFYLMLPLLLFLYNWNAVRVATGLIVVGFLSRSLVLATPIDPWSFELSILGKFEILGTGVLIGALSYQASQQGNRFLFGPALVALAVACFVFQGVAWYLWGNGVVRHLTFPLTTGIFFAMLVLRADADLPGLLAFFSGFAFVRFVGKISYGIYLTHAFFPEIFTSTLYVHHFGPAPLWVQGLGSIALSLLVPTLSWYLIEHPFLRFKERVLDGRAALRSLAAPVSRAAP
ncbi:acyltransferase family protein [Methylobacterium nodulans]|uniref:Acyltransferase 3 n=1 Tax=Methylobacterium nodulans (strain LMG 21967 / CNCM I-2342 / ORS 2060) TaxID=460265 RepID=B8IHE8_METNO|nr:acyltransferase [Methylobacterium nodulans]ACL61611.1 acyltransferase 3 [Methylobacterium nodulans ORS 2060]